MRVCVVHGRHELTLVEQVVQQQRPDGYGIITLRYANYTPCGEDEKEKKEISIDLNLCRLYKNIYI